MKATPNTCCDRCGNDFMYLLKINGGVNWCRNCVDRHFDNMIDGVKKMDAANDLLNTSSGD